MSRNLGRKRAVAQRLELIGPQEPLTCAPDQEMAHAVNHPRFRGVPRHFHHRSDARSVWSDENRVQKYLDFEAALARAEGALGIIPKEAAAEIVRHCDAKFMDMAKLKEATERIGYPVLPVVQQLVKLCKDGLGEWCALGRDHAGHHRHRHHAANPRVARHRRERDRRHCGCAGGARQKIPRHADGRPQQSAAGGADHLRLQDGDACSPPSSATSSASRSCSRACWSANSAAPPARCPRSAKTA